MRELNEIKIYKIKECLLLHYEANIYKDVVFISKQDIENIVIEIEDILKEKANNNLKMIKKILNLALNSSELNYRVCFAKYEIKILLDTLDYEINLTEIKRNSDIATKLADIIVTYENQE